MYISIHQILIFRKSIKYFNTLCSFNMTQMWAFMLLCAIVRAVQYQNLNGLPQQIKGYTGESIQLTNPFLREFFIDVPKQYSKYVTFSANKLKLKLVQKLPLGYKNFSLLQQLRSPQSEEYRQLIIINKTIFLFKSLKSVEIIHEVGSDFIRKSAITINQIQQGNTYTKAYIYKQKAMLFAGHFAYAVSKYGNYDIYNYFDRSVSHMEWVKGTDYVFIAEYNLGLGIYEIKDKKFVEVNSLQTKDFKRTGNLLSIQDVTLKYIDKNKIYVLDRFSGIHQIKYDSTNISHLEYEGLVFNHIGCYSMDTVENDYFVLSCANQNSNYLLEVIIKNDTPHVLPPLFKNHYILDVEVGSDFYLSLSRKVINVYWNTKKNHLPEEYREGNNLIIAATQVISLVSANELYYLYAVSENTLQKYEIIQSNPKLQFTSNTPLVQDFTITIYGSCQSLNKSLTTTSVDPDKEFCSYNSGYRLIITEPNKTEKSDVSASISIIIILLVVLLILIWICLKKYKQLEAEARKMLQKYKIKNEPNRFEL